RFPWPRSRTGCAGPGRRRWARRRWRSARTGGWRGWSRGAGRSNSPVGACLTGRPASPCRTGWRRLVAMRGCAWSSTHGIRTPAMTAEAGGGWSAWPAPAKLNLFLRVTGRRPDGLHALQTVFRLLDWGDTVSLRVRRDGRIERHGEPVPGLAAADDLVVRAANMLQEAANCPLGADISVEKRIPPGRGLGGGSSDAATVLRALDHLWGLGWPVDRLAGL